MISSLLIGLGNIGIGYDVSDDCLIDNQTQTHAKALIDSPHFDLVCIIDESPEMVERALRIIADPIITDKATGLGILAPDLTVIAVGTTEHAKVIESLLNPPRILVLEKPAGSSSAECLKIESWAYRNNVQIFVNYFRRYLSCTINSRTYLGAIATGKFLSAKITAYGTPLNIHSHFIDLGLFLANQDIFCECTKEKVNRKDNLVVAFCANCNATFTLSGIGEFKQDISMVLEYEYIVVMAVEDGKKIEIIDKADFTSRVFEVSAIEYANYQKVVYERIAGVTKLDEVDDSYLGLEQAKKVHLFLESVGCGDELQ